MEKSYEVSFINKIITDFQKGDRQSSFDKLKEFLNNNPSNEIARYNFAYMCEQLNHIDFAIDNYNQVIKINAKNWRSKVNLYLIYMRQKKFDLAFKLVNDVLKLKINYQPALRDKAIILYFLNKPDEALPFAKKSIDQNSLDYIAFNALGLILMKMELYGEAQEKLIKAININPKYPHSYNNLGKCFHYLLDKKNSLLNFNKALDLNANFFDAINNIANYYNETGQCKKALDYYNRALQLDSNNSEIYFNIGLAYSYLQNFKKANEFFKKSFLINSNNNLLKMNYSFVLLIQHRYKEAWELHDGRLKLDEFKNRNHHINKLKEKLWSGEKIDKKNKILIIREQGVGDEILYASMYTDLINKFPNSKIETDPRLISLFNRSFKKQDIFLPYSTYSKSKKELKKFDTVMYAGSLGRLFRNNSSDFPKKHFLHTDENQNKIFKDKLQKIDSNKKIGISWRSKINYFGLNKPLNLDSLQPILELNQFTFINLQYGNTNDEIKSFYEKSKIKILNINDIDLFNDFESQSALLKNLDLFISIGNSTCQLAGALGVETWTIKPKPHILLHYWLQPGSITPWYSSIKLFPNEETLEKTIQNIKNALIQKFIN